MKNFDLSLYLVTESSLNPHYSLQELVAEAVEGGVTIVQLREKNNDPRNIIEKGKALLKILQPKNIPLIVNDYPEIAKEIGANGVHLGNGDTDLRKARELLGEKAIIGLSIGTIGDLKKNDIYMANYLAASPVFNTNTKVNITKPLLLKGLRELRASTSLPLVAIGGIDEYNAWSVLDSGADGLAVVSAICGSESPKTSAIQIKTILERYQSRKLDFPNRVYRVLTIAGSDSGGGAGIQADLKTFEALSCYGMSAITALTSQNTKYVKSVFTVPPTFVTEQIEVVTKDIGLDAIKIGMLYSKEVIEEIVRLSLRNQFKNIVVDPVMISKSGDKLLQEDAITCLKEKLLPLASIVTPNIPEAEALTGIIIKNESDIEKAAKSMLNYCRAVIIKGGHSQDTTFVKDFYLDSTGIKKWLIYDKIQTKNTHGTGCTFSAAIAAYKAIGLETLHAVCAARDYLQSAIDSGSNREIGKGSGPVDHGWKQRLALR